MRLKYFGEVRKLFVWNPNAMATNVQRSQRRTTIATPRFQLDFTGLLGVSVVGCKGRQGVVVVVSVVVVVLVVEGAHR